MSNRTAKIWCKSDIKSKEDIKFWMFWMFFNETFLEYAVKAQTSLAPLSRFRGSLVTTAHAHQCCIFQSYAKTVPSRMKLTKPEPHSWDPRQRTTWSRRVTSDFNSVYAVKAQTSLAPLSRFRGSRVTTGHAHQCCRFQSYAKTVPSRMKLTSEVDKAWTTFLGSTTTDHVITACDVWL